jgi:hypothetical protein
MAWLAPWGVTLKVILRRYADHYASAMLRIVSNCLKGVLARVSSGRLYKTTAK